MGNELSDSEICSKNGWKVGDRLVGDEGYGPTTILITAIGLEHILAMDILQNGKPTEGKETMWTLQCRDWRKE